MGDVAVLPDPVVYMINAIDSLADFLPRYVRHGLNHYSGMVLARRYLSTQPSLVLDGGNACEIACVALWVTLECDGKLVSHTAWDSAVKQVFPCEVVHRGTISSIENLIGGFISALKFDLHVPHPFETLSLLLADLPKSEVPPLAEVALGVVNSLYRTPAILDQAPYVIAIAGVVGAMLLTGVGDCGRFLSYLPVDSKTIQNILCVQLAGYMKTRELPLPDPPAIQAVTSPSSRTGRSVSRQSSRAISTGKTSNASLKRKRMTPLKPLVENSSDPLASLAWALLPRDSENRPPQNGSMSRPISLAELKVLRELARNPDLPSGIIKLSDVACLSASEEAGFRNSYGGDFFLVNGFFDAAGTQFDSVLRLMKSKEQLLDVIEQLLTAAHYLNEHKICHFGIEPRSCMIVGNQVKIASFASATMLPNTPNVLPSLEYRAPELLLGHTNKDNLLAADLWSLGCLIAETARIFFVNNRYEDPLIVLNDDRPKRPDPKGPLMDKETYTYCRYVMKIAAVLNAGSLPSVDVWPGITKRQHYDKVSSLIQYENKKYPPVGGTSSPDALLQAYIKENNDGRGIVSEIVKALLRWCPERRCTPLAILRRIAKHRLSLVGTKLPS